MKYALVPINVKSVYAVNEDGQIVDKEITRYVLIKYKKTRKAENPMNGFMCTYYTESAVLLKDPYFTNREKSHQYIFTNDGYVTISVGEDPLEQIHKDKFKPYHSYDMMFLLRSPVLLSCKTDEEAIIAFLNSEYYDMEKKAQDSFSRLKKRKKR